MLNMWKKPLIKKKMNDENEENLSKALELIMKQKDDLDAFENEAKQLRIENERLKVENERLNLKIEIAGNHNEKLDEIHKLISKLTNKFNEPFGLSQGFSTDINISNAGSLSMATDRFSNVTDVAELPVAAVESNAARAIAPKKRYFCNNCDYSTNIKGHFLTHQKETCKMLVDDAKPKKDHRCPICLKDFKTRDLENHLNRFTKEAVREKAISGHNKVSTAQHSDYKKNLQAKIKNPGSYNPQNWWN